MCSGWRPSHLRFWLAFFSTRTCSQYKLTYLVGVCWNFCLLFSLIPSFSPSTHRVWEQQGNSQAQFFLASNPQHVTSCFCHCRHRVQCRHAHNARHVVHDVLDFPQIFLVCWLVHDCKRILCRISTTYICKLFDQGLCTVLSSQQWSWPCSTGCGPWHSRFLPPSKCRSAAPHQCLRSIDDVYMWWCAHTPEPAPHINTNSQPRTRDAEKMVNLKCV